MLTKETDGKISAKLTSPEQIELCDTVYVNGIKFTKDIISYKAGDDHVRINGVRFNRETDYQEKVRTRAIYPGTGHTYDCNCFYCNH